jgi:polyphenol oxidase
LEFGVDIGINFRKSTQPFGVITLERANDSFFGLRHGFTGQGVFAAGVSLADARQRMAEIFAEADVILPQQSHSDTIVQVHDIARDYECSGDALFISRELKSRLILGIRTADCVPLLIASARSIALVHAGWRGLANGIIAKTLALFKDNEPLSVLIGPCGGKDTYQVGDEVLIAIGASSVSVFQSTGKYLLNMPAVAQKQILACHPQAQIFNTDVCTISDLNFHSYRRDGDNSGRNLSFIVLD